MRADMKIFEVIFPDKDGAFEDPYLSAVFDQNNADREPLTEAERVRLQMLKKEAEIEIRRAFGHRKQLRREHRHKLSNSVSAALSSLASLFSLSK